MSFLNKRKNYDKTQKKLTGKSVIARDFKINKSLYLMVLPVIIFYFVFHYMPMYGAIIAFKNFKPQLGVWESDWVG